MPLPARHGNENTQTTVNTTLTTLKNLTIPFLLPRKGTGFSHIREKPASPVASTEKRLIPGGNGVLPLRTVSGHSAISAGMTRARKSCCTGKGATFEVISQNRENSRVGQPGCRTKVKKTRGEISSDLPLCRGRRARIAGFVRDFLISGLVFAKRECCGLSLAGREL